MIFNKHFELQGKHAILSASSWRWLNDDPEGLVRRLCSSYAQSIGTILHEVAYNHIKYRIKMNKYDRKNVMLELLSKGIPGIVVDNVDLDGMFETLMAYVNDCINYKMEPEVILCYSRNAFGTTDAIHYDEKTRFLRIHDYKSGSTPTHMEQLKVYAALFCLEYRIKVTDLSGIELRIYQNKEVNCYEPEADEILEAMNTIVSHDDLITELKEEA